MPEGLPAAVVPFEHYMYADDRVGAPMSFFIRATFSGSVDPPAFVSAVERVRPRHPFSRALIEGSRRGMTASLSWIAADETLRPFIGFSGPGEKFPSYPEDWPGIDLKREIGLRFFITRDVEGGTVLLMQVHHCVSDAVGAIGLLKDVLAAYDGRASLRPVDAALLARRRDFGLAPRRRHDAPTNADEALQSLREAKPLVEPDAAPLPGGIAPFPAWTGATIAAEALARLRREAHARHATLNDILLRNLFLAIHAWRLEAGNAGAMRLTMPVDMRGEALAAMPMANVVGMAFLERDPAELADADALLDGIVAETRRIKARHEAANFIDALAIGGSVEGGLRFVCASSRCLSTAVLSNLVRPFERSQLVGGDGRLRAGNLIMESCALLPPIRPLTSVSFGVLTYAGSMTVALHYDASVITKTDASLLLRLFVGDQAVTADP